MVIIYHVTKDWDGESLLALSIREDWSDELAEVITTRWPDCDPWAYYQTDGQYVHCHATITDAIEYRDEWCEGGIILEIDATDLEIEEGSEYPHPVIKGEIPAWCIGVFDDAKYLAKGAEALLRGVFGDGPIPPRGHKRP